MPSSVQAIPGTAKPHLSGAAFPTPGIEPAALRSWRLTRSASADTLAAYWRRLSDETKLTCAEEGALADDATMRNLNAYSSNIESMVGTTKLPVGIAGPLRVNGSHASGGYLIPLATTEAALVASYARGAEVLTRSGGVDAAILSEGVIRSPAFVFTGIADAMAFGAWVGQNIEVLRRVAEATTRHGKLVSIDPVLDADIAFLVCRYTTGDASGQNMVTFATEALCGHIEEHCPIRPLHWFLEGNLSGDKKASFLGMITGRGRKVTACATIPAELVERYLRTSVDRILAYARVAQVGATQSGQFGAQGHYANGLAVLYIATGQDAACVAESSMGNTRLEARGRDLFISVTLPNIMVGTVGGGTGLPSQSAGLSILGLKGAGKARAMAEVTAALCLAGEVSIMAALSAGQFGGAHMRLARSRK